MKHALALGMLLLCSGCIIVSSEIECGQPVAASPPFYGYEDFVRDGIARNEALMQNFECEYEIAYEKVNEKIPDVKRVTRVECRQVQQGKKFYVKGMSYFADGHKEPFEIAFDGEVQRAIIAKEKVGLISQKLSLDFDTIDEYTNLSFKDLPMSRFLVQSEILSVESTDIWNEFGAVFWVKPLSSTPENREEIRLIFRIEAGVVPYRMERYQTRQSKDPAEEYEVLDMQGLAPGVRVPTKIRAVKYEMVDGWRVKRSECIVRVSKWTLNPEVSADLFKLTFPKNINVVDLRK